MMTASITVLNVRCVSNPILRGTKGSHSSLNKNGKNLYSLKTRVKHEFIELPF